MDRFDWLPSESAPKDYPMEIEAGRFFLTDGTHIDILARQPLNHGWGELGSTRDIGPLLKAMPSELAIRYFSFIEGKFYAGRFQLPHDSLLEHFQTGFSSRITGETTTYTRILVGVAPEGHISVWMAGEGFVWEAATFIAREVEFEWEKFKGNSLVDREGYIEAMTRDRLGAEVAPVRMQAGIVRGQFLRYGRQYPYAFSVVGDGLASSMRLQTFNGENQWYDLMRPVPERDQRGVPHSVRLEWSAVDGIKRHGAIVEFDEKEAFAVFEKFSVMRNTGDAMLEFKIGNTNRGMSIRLTNQEFIYEFEKTATRVFRRRN